MMSFVPPAIGQEYKLRITTPKVEPGNLIVVECISPANHNKNAWIGFYSKDANDKDCRVYTFLLNLTANKYDAEVPADPGSYNFRVFADESYTPAAVSETIQVKEGGLATVVPGTGTPAESNLAQSNPATPVVTLPRPVNSSVRQDDKGTEVGVNGGMVENPELGVTVNIPQGSVKTATPITIRRAENPPPLASARMPSTLTSLVYPGPVLDLGPSATRFDQPVNVRLKWPELAGLDPKQFEPEVGWYDGATWQPLDTVEFKDGELSFSTDHFSLFWPVVGGVITLVSWYEMQQWANVWKTPEILITPDKMPKTHLDKIKLPEKLEFPLNLPQCGFNNFIPVNRPAVFPANGATMVTRKEANCWDSCNYVASVLLAKNDLRFKLFKIVQGKVTVKNRKGQLVTGDHAWIELKVGNQVYVLDTTYPTNNPILVFIPRAEAYRRDKLLPITQWNSQPDSSRPYAHWAGEPDAGPDSSTENQGNSSGSGGASGTYPAEPFNGMQITYSVSGAQLNAPKDKQDFTTTRCFEGSLAGDTLMIKGTTSELGGNLNTEYGSFYYMATAAVWVDDNRKEYKSKCAGDEIKDAPENHKVSYGKGEFSVSVPIPATAKSGGFSIDMTYVNPRFGDRGLVVSGTLKSPSDNQPGNSGPAAGNQQGNSTPASGTQREDPATVVKDTP